VFAFDGTQQIGPGAEVVTGRRIVALPCRFTDLPIGHGIHATLGKQPLSR
jgi:hypothetical protein